MSAGGALARWGAFGVSQGTAAMGLGIGVGGVGPIPTVETLLQPTDASLQVIPTTASFQPVPTTNSRGGPNTGE